MTDAENLQIVLLYTFSTIPQTLAGVGALLAVVVLHRLQIVETAVTRAAHDIEKQRGSWPQISTGIRNAFVAQDWNHYFRLLVEAEHKLLGEGDKDQIAQQSWLGAPPQGVRIQSTEKAGTAKGSKGMFEADHRLYHHQRCGALVVE